TDRSPQAFRYVQPDDYRQTYAAQQPPPPARQPSYCGPYGCPPPPLYGPPYYGPAYYYGPGYYPYYWGPQFSFFMDGAFMADVASMAARAASAAIDARLIISWGRFCRKFASGPWQIDNRWPELQ